MTEESEWDDGVGRCCEYCDWSFLNRDKSLEEKIRTLKIAILETRMIVSAGHGNPSGYIDGHNGVASRVALDDMEEELRQLEKELEQS